mmetsp:Transcript_26684/g.67228  ORF Transcript_26684/g.67228 Transcript_26684/m.67228 type:complete len:1177 (+) Transcript_26684:833-4363(+)
MSSVADRFRVGEACLPFAGLELLVSIYRELAMLPRSTRRNRGRYLQFFLRALATLTKTAKFLDIAEKSSEEQLGLAFERAWSRIKVVLERCETRIIRIRLTSAVREGRGIIEHVQFDGTPLATIVQGGFDSTDCFGVLQSFAHFEERHESEVGRELLLHGRADERPMARVWKTIDCVKMGRGHSDLQTYLELRNRLTTVRDLVGSEAACGDGSPVFTITHYGGDGATEGVLSHYCGLRHEDPDGVDSLRSKMSLWTADVCSGHSLHNSIGVGVAIFLKTEKLREEAKSIARNFHKSARALRSGAKTWLGLVYLHEPLQPHEECGYAFAVRALLEDGSQSRAKLVEILLRLQLRFVGDMLLGAVPPEDLEEVQEIVLRLNFVEIQFGRFGNSIGQLRRAAAAMLVGIHDLGKHVLRTCSRKGFLQMAMDVGLPWSTFANAAWGAGLAMVPFERAEKRLLRRDNIRQLANTLEQLADEVVETRTVDWDSIARHANMNDEQQAQLVADVGTAIEAAAAKVALSVKPKLDAAPWSLLLADDAFSLPAYLDRLAAADPATLDAGFSLKVQHLLRTQPATIQLATTSLRDCCELLMLVPTSIYFCERVHKYSSKGHKGVSAFDTVAEGAWSERFQEANGLRAPAARAAASSAGPQTLAEAWQQSGGHQVRANSIFYKESLAKNATLEMQRELLVSCGKTYREAVATDSAKQLDLRNKVREHCYELRSSAAAKLAKKLAARAKAGARKMDAKTSFMMTNTLNIAALITNKTFFDEMTAVGVRLGQQLKNAATEQCAADADGERLVMQQAEGKRYRLPAYSLPSLDFRITEICRRSAAGQEMRGGVLFVRPRDGRGYYDESEFFVYLVAHVSHLPYALGVTSLEVTYEGADATLFWKTTDWLALEMLEPSDDVFYLAPPLVTSLSPACMLVPSIVTPDNIWRLKGIERLQWGQPFKRKQAEGGAHQDEPNLVAAPARVHIREERDIDVNKPATRDHKDYDAIAQQARDELERVRAAAAGQHAGEAEGEDADDFMGDEVVRAFPRGSAWTIVNKNVAVDVWRMEVVSDDAKTALKACGLFAMKDFNVNVFGKEEAARDACILFRNVLKFAWEHGLSVLASDEEEPGLHTVTCREMFRATFASKLDTSRNLLKSRGKYFQLKRNKAFEDLDKLGTAAIYDAAKVPL